MAVRLPWFAKIALLDAAPTDACVTAAGSAGGASMATRAFWRFGASRDAGPSRPISAAGDLPGRCTERGLSWGSPFVVAPKRSSNEENRSPKKRFSKEARSAAAMAAVVCPSSAAEAGSVVKSVSRLARRTRGICELTGARYSPVFEFIVPKIDSIRRPPRETGSEERTGVPPNVKARAIAKAAITATIERNARLSKLPPHAFQLTRMAEAEVSPAICVPISAPAGNTANAARIVRAADARPRRYSGERADQGTVPGTDRSLCRTGCWFGAVRGDAARPRGAQDMGVAIKAQPNKIYRSSRVTIRVP